jgi:hypothetical protein
VIFEDTMTNATKHLRSHSAAMLDGGDFQMSIEIDDTIRDLESGVATMQQRLAVLSEPLQELVETAVAIDPPDGCRVAVSVQPDIYVQRPDGHFVGFRTGVQHGADGQPQQVWVPQRTSWVGPIEMRVGGLQELIDFYGRLDA